LAIPSPEFSFMYSVISLAIFSIGRSVRFFMKVNSKKPIRPGMSI